MNKRIISILLVMAMLAMSLTGCKNKDLEAELASLEKIYDYQDENYWNEDPTEGVTENQTLEYVEDYPNPPYSKVFTTFDEMEAQVYYAMKDGDSSVEFYVKDLSFGVVALNMSKYIYAGMYTNEFDSSRNAYKIKLLNIKYREYYYVLKAYKTNDTANLTDRQRKLYDKAVQIINENITADMTDMQKAETIHKYLIENVFYDYMALAHMAEYGHIDHTAFGALVNGAAVCDGYAEAYNLLMNMMNIPCKMVTGSTPGGLHAWNIVCIDGQWGHVDVTWDDSSKDNMTVSKDYFFITDTQISKDHYWIKINYPATN
ncbi:MAG: hypothetical protein IKL73_09005 [Lachnospiraceae bacterium]|nr:hypothetical protein [Lachnospira sp.]MBQ8730451.1 hypothetical protein [Lachnospiraceae bacterium]MBR6698378.1 hypothetical protein [Lachnospiraceae bacterium]